MPQRKRLNVLATATAKAGMPEPTLRNALAVGLTTCAIAALLSVISDQKWILYIGLFLAIGSVGSTLLFRALTGEDPSTYKKR